MAHACANVLAINSGWADGGWLENFNISPNPIVSTVEGGGTCTGGNGGGEGYTDHFERMQKIKGRGCE